MSAVECGGCRGEGAHQKFCPQRPGYHPWKRLAALAEDIGDQIGGNDPELANHAYQLGARISAAIPEHPFNLTTAPTPDAHPASRESEQAAAGAGSSWMSAQSGLTLVIPLDYKWDVEATLNKGRAYVEVPVEYDPDLATRGERRVNPYGPCPIVLREPNDQVLLHEILHVVIAGYGRPNDPHEHRLVNRIEVALWETGWRMTDPRFQCPGRGEACPDSCYCTDAPAPTAEPTNPDPQPTTEDA